MRVRVPASKQANLIWLAPTTAPSACDHKPGKANCSLKAYPLHLDRAEDSFILQHSIAWALDEAQPDALSAGGGRRVAGWLLMDDNVVRDAAQHWARAMLRRQQKTVLIRLHDPAVLWAVWRVLTPEQYRPWLGAIQRWFLLDPLAELTELTAPPAPHVADTVQSNSLPFPRPPATTLSEQQWQDIQHIAPLNRASSGVWV